MSFSELLVISEKGHLKSAVVEFTASLIPMECKEYLLEWDKLRVELFLI